MPDLEETVDFGKIPTVITISIPLAVKVDEHGYVNYSAAEIYYHVNKNRRVKKLIKEMKDAEEKV